MTGERLAAAALALVGAPFRLHGRDPATGLDCVGVVASALAGVGTRADFPPGYALRMRRIEGVAGIAARCGLARADDDPQPGDILIARPAPCQFHLLIATARDRCVHAHAGLRRVVESPLPPDWPIASRWRLAASD